MPRIVATIIDIVDCDTADIDYDAYGYQIGIRLYMLILLYLRNIAAN